MVARYSTGPRYAEHAAIDAICSGADVIREQALHFAEADMAAFSAVIDATGCPNPPTAKPPNGVPPTFRTADQIRSDPERKNGIGKETPEIHARVL
jgi:hypothetical protein